MGAAEGISPTSSTTFFAASVWECDCVWALETFPIESKTFVFVMGFRWQMENDNDKDEDASVDASAGAGAGAREDEGEEGDSNCSRFESAPREGRSRNEHLTLGIL